MREIRLVKFLIWLFVALWLRLIGWRMNRAFARAEEAGNHIDPRRHLYVFGDSLSDTGNVHHMVCWLRAASPTPSPPYYAGRFSNGPNWIDLLAAEMGLTSVSAWQGGTNFAYGGAQVGFGLSTLIPFIPNIGEQIEFFARTRKAFALESWIALLGGHNNLFATVHGRGDVGWSQALDLLMIHLDRLYELGGRKFIVPNLFPIHRCPESPVAKRDFMRLWLDAFNHELESRLDTFRNAHADVCVVSPDLAWVANEILDRPDAYGFICTDAGCYDATSKTTIGDPSEHFWWDECHPTAGVQQRMADCAHETLSPCPVP